MTLDSHVTLMDVDGLLGCEGNLVSVFVVYKRSIMMPFLRYG